MYRTYPMTSGGRRGAITDLLTTSRHPFRSFDTLRDSAVQVQSLSLATPSPSAFDCTLHDRF